MRALALLGLLVLVACAGGRAPENPNAVPNVLLSINRARQTSDYIYVRGLSGRDAGQQVLTFLITPDDQILCTVQTSRRDPSQRTTATGHRLIVEGLYVEVTGGLLPNVAPIETPFTTNFTVEAAVASVKTVSQAGVGDPRFARMTRVFATLPTPCWGTT